MDLITQQFATEQETGICENCGADLEPVYAPIDTEERHREIAGYTSCECRELEELE